MAQRSGKTKRARFDKAAIVRRLCEEIAAKELTIRRAAESAREAATHEESQPETDKDTFALEASYLAGAHAARARELAAIQKVLTFMPLRAFGEEDPVDLSAIVEVELRGKRARYFIAGHGGGIKIQDDEGELVVVTPESPMGLELVEKRVGDEVRINGSSGEILAVY